MDISIFLRKKSLWAKRDEKVLSMTFSMQYSRFSCENWLIGDTERIAQYLLCASVLKEYVTGFKLNMQNILLQNDECT